MTTDSYGNSYGALKEPCYWCDTPTHYRVPMSFPVSGAGCLDNIQTETCIEPMCKACAAENGYRTNTGDAA